jgi:hypothetical protein
MSDYTPDKWVVLKIPYKTETLYKVLGGWYGGYAGSDAWRMNSGITKAVIGGFHVVFYGHSGSQYSCHRDAYGVTLTTAGLVKQLEDRFGAEVMPEDTEWMDLNYSGVLQ